MEEENTSDTCTVADVQRWNIKVVCDQLDIGIALMFAYDVWN